MKDWGSFQVMRERRVWPDSEALGSCGDAIAKGVAVFADGIIRMSR